MGVYRLVWLVTVGMLCAVGLIHTVLSVSVAGQVGAAIGSGIVAGVYADLTSKRTTTAAPGWRHVATASGLGAGVGWATLGPVLQMTLPTLAIVVLLKASSPRALLWYVSLSFRARKRGSRTTDQDTENAIGDSPQWSSGSYRLTAGPSDTLPKTSDDFVRLLTNAELCLSWRISHLALQRHHTVANQLKIVMSRQKYLDEMERRNPAGFAQWLYSGARPGSAPTNFLHGTNDTTA